MCRLLRIAGVLLACGGLWPPANLSLAQSSPAEPVPCLELPGNIIAWWRAESSYYDEIGGFAPEFVHAIGFAEGLSGRSWQFDGEQSELRLAPAFRSAIDGNLNPRITFEAWIAPEQTTNRQVFLTWENFETQDEFEFFLKSPTNEGQLWTIGVANDLGSLSILADMSAGLFQHLAFTYEVKSGTIVFFLNGVLHSSGTFSSGPSFLNRIKFGGNDGSRFKGRIDEILLYSRILTAEEILRSASAREGHCFNEHPPTFFDQPSTRSSGTIGEPFSIYADVQGAGPIDYQWRFRGTNIPGQNSPILVNTNVSLADAGPYDLIASNFYGVVTSRVSTATIYLLANGSFDKGSLAPWELRDLPDATLPTKVARKGRGPAAFVSDPIEGPYSLSHGFSGQSAGLIRVHQDLVELPAGLQLRCSFRARWNLQISTNATLPRDFRLLIEPAAGGDPLFAKTLLTIHPNTTNFAPHWQTETIDLTQFANQKVRIVFEWTVPEPGSVLAMFELDAVHLFNSSGSPISASLKSDRTLEINFANRPEDLTLWSSFDLQNWGLAQVMSNGLSTIDFEIQTNPPARFFRTTSP